MKKIQSKKLKIGTCEVRKYNYRVLMINDTS